MIQYRTENGKTKQTNYKVVYKVFGKIINQ